MRARIDRKPRWLLLAALALLPACGPANVVIRRGPATATGTLGPFRRCVPVETPCQTDPVQDSSRFNAPNTTFLALPECPYGIDRILVQDSGGSSPTAVVQCAAPPPGGAGGIPTTAPGGATQPATPAPSGGIPTTAPGGGTRPAP